MTIKKSDPYHIQERREGQKTRRKDMRKQIRKKKGRKGGRDEIGRKNQQSRAGTNKFNPTNKLLVSIKHG